jgi:DNA-binding response OmpR family regulator
MPYSRKQILAIDDTPSIRTFLRISLEAYGAAFHEAATAGEGLALCESLKPDLVVLDLGLPDRDGLDILPEIKQAKDTGAPPKVIILSVRKEPRIKEQARALGADAYLTKPFLMEDLIEVIDHHLNLS